MFYRIHKTLLNNLIYLLVFILGIIVCPSMKYITKQREIRRNYENRPFPLSQEQNEILEKLNEKARWIREEAEDFKRLKNFMVFPGNIVEYYLLRGDVKEALYWHEQVNLSQSHSRLTGERVYNDEAWDFYYRGSMFEVEGNLEKANENYCKAANLVPFYHYILSHAYTEMALGRNEEAASFFCSGIIDADRYYLYIWDEYPDIALRLRVLGRPTYLRFKPFSSLGEVCMFIKQNGKKIQNTAEYKKAIGILERGIEMEALKRIIVFDRGGFTTVSLLPVPVQLRQEVRREEEDELKSDH